MSDNEYPQGSNVGQWIVYLLLAILLGAVGYLFVRVNQFPTELAQVRDNLLDEQAKLRETSSVTAQTSRRTVESLKAELDAARMQASQLAGQARSEAEKRADVLAANLQRVQQESNQKVAAVSAEVGQVKEQTVAANSKISEVSTDVGNVKSDVAATRSELEKTIAQLKGTQGDLGVQSGLIATNSKELAALRALGERNYFEFKLGKTKAPQKIGDVSVLLKRADPKNNRYTIELYADDKRIEKKDKTLNEPVQFILSKATQPFELIVNEVKKDLIVGYIASPKVQTTRGASN